MGVSTLVFKEKGYYFVDRIEVLILVFLFLTRINDSNLFFSLYLHIKTIFNSYVKKFDLNLIQLRMCNESVLIEFELDAYII